MRLASIMYLVIALISIQAGTSFSASEDEIQRALDQQKFSDNLKPGMSQGDSSYKGSGLPANLGSEDLKTILEREQVADPSAMQDKTTDSARRAKLTVKVLPGDGLVKISWKLSNYQPRPEDGQLQFTVSYGTES